MKAWISEAVEVGLEWWCKSRVVVMLEIVPIEHLLRLLLRREKYSIDAAAEALTAMPWKLPSMVRK